MKVAILDSLLWVRIEEGDEEPPLSYLYPALSTAPEDHSGAWDCVLHLDYIRAIAESFEVDVPTLLSGVIGAQIHPFWRELITIREPSKN